MNNPQPVFHIKLYGTRGSTPVCEPGFQKFGGNTTCIYADLLTNDRSKLIVIFDAGTGIRKLGQDILAGKLPDTENILLVFSHFHLDHIQGLPFFDPAYNPAKKIGIFSPHRELKKSDLHNIFATQMQKEYFPVQFDKMGAHIDFYTVEDYHAALNADSQVAITYQLHNHPGGAYSYRMESQGKSVAICTDLEHGRQIDPQTVEFCRDADLLIHDAQYTAAELEKHRGWGHSSYAQAMETAERAGVKQLVFTHHDPAHDDDFLLKKERYCREKFPNCIMGKDGAEFFI